jgi:hypothetical protein
MKIAASILGILGGIGGLAISIIITVIGNLGIGLGASGAEIMTGAGWAALILSLVGIIGGGLAISRPTPAGILMLVSGAGGFIALTTGTLTIGYIFGGPLLIAGGVLALIVGRKR